MHCCSADETVETFRTFPFEKRRREKSYFCFTEEDFFWLTATLKKVVESGTFSGNDRFFFLMI